MSEMPELDIPVIANNDSRSGCGEPAVTVIAPAIANVIFNAVGVRVRSLPTMHAAMRTARRLTPAGHTRKLRLLDSRR